MTKSYSGFSFVKGFSQIKLGDVAEVRRELMDALKVTTVASLRNLEYGLVNISHWQYVAVEEVLRRHGIVEIWDTEDPNPLPADTFS